MQFDPSAAAERLAKMWALPASFGRERTPSDVLLQELVSDRYALVNGLQLLRDELQFAGTHRTSGDLGRGCGADFSLPSVVTTLGYTNCGDRIQSGDTTTLYERLVAQRFATLSELGALKSEAFFPTGGGTDHGATLAHVTVSHQLDELLRKWVYQGNARSFVLVNLDLKTHVGRLDSGNGLVFGQAQESPWREPRAACGAMAGTLQGFDPGNAIHVRLREDLGEANFAHLTRTGVKTAEGIDITLAVAAAIVAVRGLHITLQALTRELDDRGLAHVTACLTVNRTSRDDTIIYLARGTAFAGELRWQGLGLDASQYGGRLVERKAEQRLELTYEGRTDSEFAVESARYAVPRAHKATVLMEAPTDLG